MNTQYIYLNIIKKINQIISRNMKIIFGVTFILTILNHMFFITNFYPNHDTIANFNTEHDVITSGRWFLKYVAKILDSYPVPWIGALLSFAFIALSVCLIVSIFDVEHLIHGLVIGLLFISFPALTNTLFYSYTVDEYSLGILLMLIGVLLTKKFKYGFIISGIFIAFSMGIYQAPIGFVSGSYVMLLIIELLKPDSEIKAIIRKALKYLCSLVLGGGLYWIILNIMLTYRNMSLSSYKDINSLNDGRIIETFFKRLLLVYHEFINFFIYDRGNYFGGFCWAYLLVIVLSIVMVLDIVYASKIYNSMLKGIGILVCLLLMPVAVCAVYLFSSVHTLMIYSYVLVPIFGVVMIEQYGKREYNSGMTAHIIRNTFCLIVLISTLFISYRYCLVSNQMYMKSKIGYEVAYSIGVQLSGEIHKQKNYQPGMKFMIAGTLEGYELKQKDNPDYDFVGTPGPQTLIDYGITNDFLYRCFGTHLNAMEYDEMSELIENNKSEIKSMKSFPQDDSVKVIDGVMVIKYNDSDIYRSGWTKIEQ